MNDFKLSVIICTHNPVLSYITEALNALRYQTYPKSEWELIIIDNASRQDLSEIIDVSWHPNARYFREDRLGIFFARIRGMQEALAELILFVDDDNILSPDYIEKGLRKAREWPMIGAWGGQLRPRFECQPPEWIKQYRHYIAVRELDKDKWSNLVHQYESTPPAAGMFLRKVVSRHYLQLIQAEPRKKFIDKLGNVLIVSEDTDIAFSACDIGFGTARFADLSLVHIIPKRRLEEDYLEKLIEASFYSQVILWYFWGKNTVPRKEAFLKKCVNSLSVMFLPHRQRRFCFAEMRAREKARLQIEQISK